MRKVYTSFLLSCILSISGTGEAMAGDGPLAAENFTATVSFTSDYVFRGVSFSDNDPAVQASIDWGYENFYAGVWGSNLELVGYSSAGTAGDGTPIGISSIEYDFYVGYASSFGIVDYDATLTYYWFPNDEGNLKVDVLEAWLTLSHTFKDVPYSPSVSLIGAYSPDATLDDGDSIYVSILAAIQPLDRLGLNAGIGFFDVYGYKATGSNGAFCNTTSGLLCNGYHYTHWTVGATTSIKGFDLDLSYHDTNESGSHVAFFGSTELIDDILVVAISRSF